ncbi:phage portal protein [Hymenobacter cheonanensis]|uniref:phage portal protein n=1 Tax=Hymenobacter sp. CA2-7 TaxID=3063993 RepID=UPI002712BDFC|nr:phage portal protein [Hymenobacter sp. CA2-7]MDO7888278.1 phage portal protein [Hymenobacter sp. CA2-7]
MGLFSFFSSAKSKPQAVLGDPNSLGGAATPVADGGGVFDARLVSYLNSGATGPLAGVTVNEQTAVTLSAVWACVRVIAESVAQLPLLVLDNSTRGARRLATEHPAYLLLTLEPNPRQSAFNFWELMVATAALWGNAYALIERDARFTLLGLHWVHPRNVEVIEYGGELFYQLVGEKQPRQAYEVLHIAGLGFNGVTGRSVLSVMAENMRLGLSAQQFGTNFYENGANIGGVLETAAKIDDSVLTRLRKQFADHNGGMQNSHKPLILEQGMKYVKVGMPPVDAQFIETRKVQAEEIARAFRVPQHKIGILDRSTNNNIEHQGLEFVTDTLGPWLVRIEQECKRKLLTERQKPTYAIKFDYDGLLRGDVTARGNFYKSLWGMGVLSANDIAEMEDRDHVPGGDERYVPLNMVPTTLLKEVLLKNPGASASAKPEPDPAK